MRSRQTWIGVACLAFTAVAVAAGALLLRPINLRHGAAPAAGTAALQAFGGHSWKSGKTVGHLDSALANIADYALSPATAFAQLHALNPAARFRPSTATAAPEVLVDAATRGDPQQLKAALVSLGLEQASVFANAVGGWLPVTSIAAAAARPEVAYLHASLPHRRAAVALQGDYVQHSYALRQSNPSLTGAGVTVGVLSDSFNCYAVYAANPNTVPVSGNDGYASNGFTATAEDDEADGALPASVNVLAEPYNQNGGPATPGGGAGDCLNYDAPTQLPFSDEGRAMLQIVHAVAPGASLAFYTGENSETDFANGIELLASPTSSGGAGAKVIADDLGYYDEPFYQDGIVAQAVDTVEAAGVAYFSAAGNNANASWESTSPSFTTQQPTSAANNAGEYLLNFDTSGATNATALPITIAPLVPGEYVAIVVEWDQPYITGAPNSGGSQNQVDLCVTGAPSSFLVEDYAGDTTNCTGLNSIGSDPVQVIILGNSAASTSNTAQVNLNVVVGTASRSNAPGRVIVSVQTDGQTSPAPIAQYATNSETIQGHPNAAGAAAVAAAFYFDTPQCGTSPATVEPYSSQGGAPILFSSTGTRLSTPELRQKPNFVGPDGVNNTFLGFTLASAGVTGSNGLLTTTDAQCQNNPSYPNFFGTSAATPHAAGIAALFLQASPGATPTQIYTALENSALPIGNVPTTGSSPTYNFTAGYGFIQADAAYSQLPITAATPPTPTLTLSATSIAVGSTATLTWSSSGATSCAASGSWSGTLATSGSQTVTPSAVGTDTYSLTCSDSAGASPAATATLTVTAAPSSGGGGGAWSASWLAALAGVTVAVRARRQRRTG